MTASNVRLMFTVIVALFVVLGGFAGSVAAGGEESLDGVTVETEDGTDLTVTGNDVIDGFVSVECTEGEGSYCEKEASLKIGSATAYYEGFNKYDPTGPSGSYGDHLVVTLGGEKVATVDVAGEDSPSATLIGYLGGIFFGLFG